MLKLLAVNILIFGVLVWARDATVGEVPYQASVRHDGNHTCSGSIINETWILTLASCLQDFDADMIKVVVGTIDISGAGQSLSVSLIKKHPFYEPESDYNFGYDIALLKVVPIAFDENVQPVELSEYEVSEEDEYKVSGWKVNSEDQTTLQVDVANGVDPSQCEYVQELPSKALFCLQYIKDPEIYDDPGCPIFASGKGLQGINYSKFSVAGLEVSHFKSWIVETINKN